MSTAALLTFVQALFPAALGLLDHDVLLGWFLWVEAAPD